MTKWIPWIALAVALVACEETKVPEDKPKADAVDCLKLCGRTFGACMDEVLLATGKVSAKQLAYLKKANALQASQVKGRRLCMRDCEKRRGIAANGTRVNRCLKMTSCAGFATCMKSFLDARGGKPRKP